jgi:very-short-patch-repair endonuclease
VETDSWASTAFEDDHARDLDLRRRGFTVYRYTEKQIRREPQLIVADLRERLWRGARRTAVGSEGAKP